MTFKHKDSFGAKDVGDAEHKGVYEVMRSMSFIRPVTAMEALAQAVFIQSEMCDPGNSSDDHLELLSARSGARLGWFSGLSRPTGLIVAILGLKIFATVTLRQRSFPTCH
ncbi:hypothetical protein ACTGJ9_025640 [Bradyrhizobium sp. RDM12]